MSSIPAYGHLFFFVFFFLFLFFLCHEFVTVVLKRLKVKCIIMFKMWIKGLLHIIFLSTINLLKISPFLVVLKAVNITYKDYHNLISKINYYLQ